jgi:hypothetical protein
MPRPPPVLRWTGFGKQVSLFAGYVAIFDRATETFTTYRHDSANPQSLSHDWVWAIDEDQQGSIWLGTLGRGLNRLEPATGHITRYQQDLQNPASLSDDSISTLHMDRSGVLWVGTFGGGLDRFDPARGTFTHYRERDGLPSDRIVSILEDGDAGETAAGNLWIATGRGLSKLDRDRTTFQTYDTTDGLPLTEYNRGRYRTRSGELLMSSSHGLIAFDPEPAEGTPLVHAEQGGKHLILQAAGIPLSHDGGETLEAIGAPRHRISPPIRPRAYRIGAPGTIVTFIRVRTFSAWGSGGFRRCQRPSEGAGTSFAALMS